MKIKVGDRVMFVGHPQTLVTQWLEEERIPGTVIEVYGYRGKYATVVVAWDGLNVRRFYEDHIGKSNVWSVYSEQLALIKNDEPDNDELDDPVAFFLQLSHE